MTNPLICEHGQLRRQCQHCDDAQEILDLRDENGKLRRILCNVLTACGNGSGATPQASLEFFATVPDEVAAVVMKMGNEVAALRPDAMRYQWLRSNCECMGWGSRSDAAIDAAMGAAGVPVAEYLAKVEADPRRAAALQRARERTASGELGAHEGRKPHPKCTNPDCNCVMRCAFYSYPPGVTPTDGSQI